MPTFTEVIAIRTVFWAGIVCVVAACSSNDKASVVPPPVEGQGGGGGTEGTGGTGGTVGEGDDASVTDAEEEAASCGMLRSCKVGEYCCDGTCGACAPIGVNCPIDPCGGTDAATTQ